MADSGISSTTVTDIPDVPDQVQEPLQPTVANDKIETNTELSLDRKEEPVGDSGQNITPMENESMEVDEKNSSSNETKLEKTISGDSNSQVGNQDSAVPTLNASLNSNSEKNDEFLAANSLTVGDEANESNKISTDDTDNLSNQASQRVIRDSEGPPTKKSRADLNGVPTRQYLDQTVVPILLQGLSELSKNRPAEPIEFLANYLLKHKGKFELY